MWSPSYSVVILGLLIAKLLSSASQHDQSYCRDRADGHLQPHLIATLSQVNSDEMYEDQSLEQCSSEILRNVKKQMESESLASHDYHQDRRIDPVQKRENATVLSATISSHLAAFPPAERVIFGLSNITAQPTKQLRYNKYQRLCYNVLPNGLRKTSRDPHHLIHALPLQAVTIDNDSEGSISKGGPSPSMEYNGVFTSRVPLQTLLYHGQLWYTNTRKQGVSATGKQVVEILKNGAQSFDKGELLEQLKSIKFASSALWCWVERRPYIKLPISIFVPWFLIVNIIYGKSVASNLTPLWTIGPVVAGLSIKAFIKLSAQCRWWVAEIKLKQHVINLIEGVKTGELIQQCIEGSWSRYAQVKSLVSKKKLELAYFIQHGDAITALQQNSNKKRQAFLEDFWDKYEDARIVYLYLERKLKNII